MHRTYQVANSANYSGVNQTNYSNTYTPGAIHTIYIQKPQSASEINANQTYIVTPAGTNQTWRNTSPNRGYYDSTTRSAQTNTWGAPNQQLTYCGSRNSFDRSSADDPGLMTQYYGTQKTSYARYYPQRHTRQEETIQQQSLYHSSSTAGWNNPSRIQTMPTNRVTNRPSAQKNYVSASSNYQDQERWSTSGSVQQHNAEWL